MLALSAQAQMSLGYDGGLGHIVARLGLGAINLDLGAGLDYDDRRDKDKTGLGLSALAQKPIKEFEKLTLNATGGAIFTMLPQANDNTVFTLFGGLQPELEIWDHLLVNTRMGLNVQLTPDMKIATVGNTVSIVGGVGFLIEM